MECLLTNSYSLEIIELDFIMIYNYMKNKVIHEYIYIETNII